MAVSSSNVESNLDKLLQSVTPVVPLKPIPESCIHGLNRVWNPVGNPITAYFTLGDLWKCYTKWSVYGVKTPVALNSRKDVVQYFTLYLSAIEIFTNKSPATISLSCRSLSDDSDDSDEDESESEYLSDEDESESDKLTRSASNTSSNNSSNNFSKAWDVNSEDSSIGHDDSLPRDCRSNLYIKFQDFCSPYWRIPLRNKIKELAKDYPGLMTLRSTDLSPASWMAVAWYPIYHIPSKGRVKDLSAAFLTFHTLSSYFQGNSGSILFFGSSDGNGCIYSLTWALFENLPSTFKHNTTVDAPNKNNGVSKEVRNQMMSLPPFGLASYMLIGDVWLNHGESDHVRLFDLHSAADSWLKQLDFAHHDFTFFTMKSSMQA